MPAVKAYYPARKDANENGKSTGWKPHWTEKPVKKAPVKKAPVKKAPVKKAPMKAPPVKRQKHAKPTHKTHNVKSGTNAYECYEKLVPRKVKKYGYTMVKMMFCRNKGGREHPENRIYKKTLHAIKRLFGKE